MYCTVLVGSLDQEVSDIPFSRETSLSSHKPLLPGDLTPSKWAPRRLYLGVSIIHLGSNFRQAAECFLNNAPYPQVQVLVLYVQSSKIECGSCVFGRNRT